MGIRMRTSRPAVEHPTSVSHWSCPADRAYGDSHHVGADARCAYCRETVTDLLRQQRALATPVTSTDGATSIALWQITAWAPDVDGIALYYEQPDLDGYPSEVTRHITAPKGDLLDAIRRAGLAGI